jgi:hypothetical protein
MGMKLALSPLPIYIVTWQLRAGMVESKQHRRDICCSVNTFPQQSIRTTIEELLEAVFSIEPHPKLCKEDEWD